MQAVRARDRRSERNMKNEGQAKEKMKAKKEVVLREKQAEKYPGVVGMSQRAPLLYPRS